MKQLYVITRRMTAAAQLSFLWWRTSECGIDQCFQLSCSGLLWCVNGNIISTVWGRTETCVELSCLSVRFQLQEDVDLNFLCARVSLMWKVWRPHFTGKSFLVSGDALLDRQVFEHSAQNVSEHRRRVSCSFILERSVLCCADVMATALMQFWKQSCFDATKEAVWGGGGKLTDLLVHEWS